MKPSILRWIIGGIALITTGCELMSAGPTQALTIMPAPVHEIDLVSTSHAITDALVAELRKNVPSFHPSKPLLMTTFVDLRDMDRSNELGLLLSEQVASRFTQHGYAVIETRLRSALSIQPGKGEFILSREIDKLSKQHQAYAVVVGNFTQTRNVVFLTAKVVQLQSQQVLASVDAKLPMEPNTRELLIDTGRLPSLKVTDR